MLTSRSPGSVRSWESRREAVNTVHQMKLCKIKKSLPFLPLFFFFFPIHALFVFSWYTRWNQPNFRKFFKWLLCCGCSPTLMLTVAAFVPASVPVAGFEAGFAYAKACWRQVLEAGTATGLLAFSKKNIWVSHTWTNVLGHMPRTETLISSIARGLLCVSCHTNIWPYCYVTTGKH